MKFLMGMKSYSKIILSLVVFSTLSCQTALKLFTGFRNPNVYESREDRQRYYNPWLDSLEVPYEVKTLKDEDSFIYAFESLSDFSFPMMILKSNESSLTYNIDCFEDVDYSVDLINKDNFEDIEIAADSLVSLVNELSVNHISMMNYKNSTVAPKRRYDVTIVHGMFMGKKTRKRMTYLFENLQELNSVTILDLSIDESLYKEN